MKKKVILGIVIGLLVVVIAGVLYYISYPKGNLCWPYCSGMTDQDRKDIKKTALEAGTAEWKTYTNTKYGFEFKYPINWGVGGVGNTDDTFLIEDLSTTKNGGLNSNILVWANIAKPPWVGMSAKDILLEAYKSNDLRNQSDGILGGVQSYQITYLTDSGYCYKCVTT